MRSVMNGNEFESGVLGEAFRGITKVFIGAFVLGILIGAAIMKGCG